MTPAQLEKLLLTRLVRQHGGQRLDWRRALGPIRLYDTATHPHCNWAVSPSGSIGENRAIEELCDEVRGEHPVLTA